MLRHVPLEKRSERINLFFIKDYLLKVSYSILGLEGEKIHISFRPSRLWNKTQGISTCLAIRNKKPKENYPKSGKDNSDSILAHSEKGCWSLI